MGSFREGRSCRRDEKKIVKNEIAIEIVSRIIL